MQLTLLLDPAPAGVRSKSDRGVDEIGGTARMEELIRHFDTDEQAIVWGRAMARRRGLAQIFLTTTARPPVSVTEPTCWHRV